MSVAPLFRDATMEDVPRIVAMLADDALGAARERCTDPLPASYYSAFARIESDPNQTLLVAEVGHEAVAVLQLSFIPGLSHQGAWRAQVEAVRVHASMRGQGLGHKLLQEAIRRAREHGCRMVQLTTDKSRKDAHRFYESLGFRASHEGMKLVLDIPAAPGA